MRLPLGPGVLLHTAQSHLFFKCKPVLGSIRPKYQFDVSLASQNRYFNSHFYRIFRQILPSYFCRQFVLLFLVCYFSRDHFGAERWPVMAGEIQAKYEGFCTQPTRTPPLPLVGTFIPVGPPKGSWRPMLAAMALYRVVFKAWFNPRGGGPTPGVD